MPKSNDSIIRDAISDWMSAHPGGNPTSATATPAIQQWIDYNVRQNDQFEQYVAAFNPPAPPMTPAGNFAESFGRGGQGWLAAGGGTAQFFGGASSAFADQNRGAYLTPEQRGISNLGMAPGVGAVIGAVAGSFAGNPVAGAFVGSSVGSAVSSIGGAGLERSQAERQTAEQFVAAIGAATDKIKTWSDTIEASGVAAKSLQQVMSTISGVGPMSSSTATGAIAFTRAEGEYATAQGANLAAQLANPLLSGLSNKFGSTGNLSASDFDALAVQASLSGDATTAHARLFDAQRARSPQFTEAERIKARLNAPGGWGVLNESWSDFAHDISGTGNNDYKGKHYDTWSSATRAWINDVEAADAAMGVDPTSDKVNSNLRSTATTQGLLDQSTASASAAVANFARVSSTGTAAQINNLLQSPSSMSSVRVAAANARALADSKRAEAMRPENAAARDNLLAAADTLEATASGLDIQHIGAQSTASMATVTQGQSGTNLAITRARLSGASETSLAGAIGAFAATETRVANQPRSVSGLSVDQQNALLTDSVQSVYNNKIAGYAQTESGIGVGIAQAGQGVAAAQAFGNPNSVYAAQNVEIQKQIQLQQQLNAELQKGGLTQDDRLNKEKQLASVSAQIVTNHAAAQYGLVLGTEDIQSSGVAGAMALNTRAVRLGGNASWDGAIVSGLQDKYRTALAAASTAPNASERARQLAIARETQADIQNQTDASRAPHAEQSVLNRLAADTNAYNIARDLPYVGGQSSNPYSQGGRVINDLSAQIAAENARFSHLANPNAIDVANHLAYINPLTEERASLLRTRYTATEMATVQMHEGETSGAIAASGGRFARAAHFNSNEWLSGTIGRGRPDSAYGGASTSIGGSSPQGFMADSGAAMLSVLRQMLAVMSGGANPRQVQKSSSISAAANTLAQRGMANAY